MPCPTCDHTMQNLGVELAADSPVNAVFWCPRCGTIKSRRAGSTEEFVSNSVPFWMQRPYVQLVSCNGLLHETGDDRTTVVLEHVRKVIEQETARLKASNESLLAACGDAICAIDMANDDPTGRTYALYVRLRDAISRAKGP